MEYHLFTYPLKQKNLEKNNCKAELLLKQLLHLDSARNTLISTLICSQYEAAVKNDENEKCHAAAFHSPFTGLFWCHTTALIRNYIL